MSATWVDVDPEAVSAYTADKADRLRDHSQLTRQADGITWATWLVLGDTGFVYEVTLRLHPDRWTASCDHPRLLRERQGLPIRAGQACSHMHAAAAAEAQARGAPIPVPPSAATPPTPRPAGATTGFYD
jgi:hypothetical protein